MSALLASRGRADVRIRNVNGLVGARGPKGDGLLSYRVLPNKTIMGPDGRRFIARFVTMFDYCFISFEARTDWTRRNVGQGYPVTSGGSTPTGFERTVYKSADNVSYQVGRAKAVFGANGIRCAVEPAMVNTTSFVDPIDGQTYPGHMAMLDVVVQEAAKQGVVVQLHNANDNVAIADNVSFLTMLATRYRSYGNVWICPMNEPNHADVPNINNATLWASEHTQYLTAIRGGGFTGVVVLNGLNYSADFTGLVSVLNGAPFSTDGNLVLGFHSYPVAANGGGYPGANQAYQQSHVLQYVGTYAMICDESGKTNPGVGTTDPAEQQYQKDFLTVIANLCRDRTLSGCTGTMWFGYIPGTGTYDANTMTYLNGELSPWGQLFLDYFARNAFVADTTRVAARPRSKGGHGQVEVALNGGTGNLELRPKGGNGLIINGSLKTLPAVNVVLSPGSGLTAGAAYYLYARDIDGDGIVDALIASTAGHVTGSTLDNEGVEIMIGDPTYTLVGMALAASASSWASNDGSLLNRFNRRSKRTQFVAGSNLSTDANTNWKLLATVSALVWEDDVPLVSSTGRLTAASGPVGGLVSVTTNVEAPGAAATSGGTIHAASYSAGYATFRPVPGVSEGKFDAKLYAQSSNGTIVSVQAGSEMTVTVMG